MPVMHLKEANIYYESTGTGKPPLIFIHGFTCDHSDWDFQVKALSGASQVVHATSADMVSLLGLNRAAL